MCCVHIAPVTNAFDPRNPFLAPEPEALYCLGVRHDEPQEHVAPALERFIVSVGITRGLCPFFGYPIFHAVERALQRLEQFCCVRILVKGIAHTMLFRQRNAELVRSLAQRCSEKLVDDVGTCKLLLQAPATRAVNTRRKCRRCPIFYLMRFIEHGVVVWRNDAAARGEIAKEQCVVDDDNIRMTSGFARMHLMTAFGSEEFARIHEAVIGVSVDFAPQRVRWYKSKLGAVSALRAVGPGEEPPVLVTLRDHKLATQLLEFVAAQIVIAALELNDAGVGGERIEQLRNIFCEQLLLQGERRRGDDDALTRKYGGDKIAKRFPSACAGLHHDVHVLEKSAVDNFTHGDLRRAIFITGKNSRQKAAAA